MSKTTTIKTVHLYGHEYTVEVVDGKITRVGCKWRWALADERMVGDDGWLKSQLEQALCLGQWDTK